VRLYFHGNCQMAAAATMVAELGNGWDISQCSVYNSDPAGAPEEIRGNIASADVIVVQPITRGYRGAEWLGIDYVRANARPGATIITVPSLFFRGPTPEYFYIRQPTGVEVLGFQSPYHNVVLLDFVLAGYETDDILQRMSSAFLYTKDFITAGIRDSIENLSMREAEHALDIGFSAIIGEFCWSRKIMHSINHPMRLVMARVVNEVLRCAGLNPRVAEEGPDYLSDFVIPLAPSAALHTGILDDLPGFDFVTYKSRLGMLDYFSAAINEYRRMDVNMLASLLYGDQEVRRFLGAFHRIAGPGATRSAGMASELVRGIYRALLGREPGLPEILSTSNCALDEGGERLFERILASPEFADKKSAFMQRLA